MTSAQLKPSISNTACLSINFQLPSASKAKSTPVGFGTPLQPTDAPVEKGHFYRDVAIFRYKTGTAQIFSDSEFLNIFLKRQNDPYWTQIDYVQTNIRAKIGIGQPIFIEFYADLQNINKFAKKYECEFDVV